MSCCSIFALGPLRVELDGRHLTTSRHKALALLIYLAVQQENCRREELAALFWPEFDQASAYAYLRRALWELKTMLGENFLEANREEVRLNPRTEIWLDVSEFHQQIGLADQHPHPKSEPCPQCVQALKTAAGLYRGTFLAGFNLRDSPGFDDWQSFQAGMFQREMEGTLKRLVMVLQVNGDSEIALEYANRWSALNTLNEEAHRQVMQLFFLRGERHAALRQYQECERLLRDELGTIPEAETIRLYQRIQNGTLVVDTSNLPNPPGTIAPFSLATRSPASWLEQILSAPSSLPVSHHLPTPATPFVGRRDELNEIGQTLTDPTCWLLTLLGPGGIGKTRLSLQATLEQSNAFAHGIYFVPLVAADSVLSITAAIAKALGLDFRADGPEPEQQVCNYLSDKQVLLVLDSFEHLVAWSELLQRIHTQAEGVKFLVTSRQRLQLQVEWVMNISGMKYPTTVPGTVAEIKSFSAVDLFIQTARRVRSDFQVTGDDLSALTRLTGLLDGMPLGLELAANWVKALSCEELVAELSQNLDLLETQLRDFPVRHRRLRVVFDQSWQLLNRREKRLFPRLSVFRGSFSRQAAEQVAGIKLYELAELTDKSLVQRTSDGRFVLHELLRQYGDERLGKSPTEYVETHDRYSQYFCACLNQWGEMLQSPQQRRALKEMGVDIGNARSAWDWAVNHAQINWLAQAVDGICLFCLRSMRDLEGQEICKNAAAILSDHTAPLARKLRARLLTWQAAFCLNLEGLEETRLLLDESQTVLEKFTPGEIRAEKSLLCLVRSVYCYLINNPEQAADYYEQSLSLAQESAGQVTPSILFFWKLLMNAGVLSPRIWGQLNRTLPYKRQRGDIFETACLLQTLGVIAGYHYNDQNKMASLLEESITLFQQLDDPISQSLLLDSWNTLLNIRGRFSELLPIRQKRLAMAKELGDQRMIGYTRAELGETLCHLGHYAQAETELRSGLATLKSGHSYEHALWQQHLANVLLARSQYEEAYELCRSSLDFFRAIGEKGWASTTLASLSHAEFALSKRAEAWEHASEALRLLDEIHLFAFFIPRALAILALLSIDRGKLELAHELQIQISFQPFWENSHWYADLYGNPVEAATVGTVTKDRATNSLSASAPDLWETVKILIPEIRN